MIKWVEQHADVGPRPVGERLEKLPDSLQSTSSTEESSQPDTPCVVWSAHCRDAIFSHLANHDFEQGGLLLGHVWHEEGMPNTLVCIDVVEAVPARQARGTAISLSMGTDLWNHAHQQAGADQHIVGWYHSHPGLGAFFSAVDRNTQAAFFREAWHLGLVVDPKSAQTAWFRGIESLAVENALIKISAGC